MMHSYFAPAQCPFHQHIHSFWQVDRQVHRQREYVMPSGLVEIIFSFNESDTTIAVGNYNGKLPRCFINGFNTKTITINHVHHQHFFGVRLLPAAAKQLIGMVPCMFANTLIDIQLVNTTFYTLWHQLAEKPLFEERVDIFCNWVKKVLFEIDHREQLLNDFLYGQNNHQMTVNALAQKLCYSPRHLSRKLEETTGMNCEEMLLYKKYLHAVDLMHHTNLSLTHIAYESNFFDQSHFIRTFKQYTTFTPGAYRKNKAAVKGHIYSNVC